jgi:ubiquinone biosynthesis monooxygenase Coq7
MRVNHVGEVCAQALYDSQARFGKSPAIRKQFEQSAREEEDHLAWTAERLSELGSQPSLLNPLWYAGSYVLGSIAAKLGDPHSLGFVVETERQVEAHLDEHLVDLPAGDLRSRAVIAVMKEDEARHADHAEQAGARRLPFPIPGAMALASKVMKTIAYRI